MDKTTPSVPRGTSRQPALQPNSDAAGTEIGVGAGINATAGAKTTISADSGIATPNANTAPLGGDGINTTTGSIPNAASLRQIVHGARQAALSTLAFGHKQVGDGWPVASMVVSATTCDGSPILLISGLADHTRHLHHDGRLSLLYTATPDNPADTAASANTATPPETIRTDSARLTLFGRAQRDDDPATAKRYLAMHPDAALYSGFGDFAFYRVTVEGAYWVGGFGKQRRIGGAQYLAGPCAELIASHDGIIAHMNADHPDALRDIVGFHHPRWRGFDCRLETIDCDGMLIAIRAAGNHGDGHIADINGGESPETVTRLRIAFAQTIHTPLEARQILVEMCKKSRNQMA